ncbi:MAG: DUF3379 domain-containing protein [Planctomycetes bacterium]|nr:DUF3379 domain-containing protein [Planctomycetota bacterium]
MQCRDAQFYLRLRRPTGDELGADVTADLDRHLAGCPICAPEARVADSFDRSVATAMRSVPVPASLRDKLLAQASTHQGTVIRGKIYRVAALAASLLVFAGIGFGVFTASRPKIDPDQWAMDTDEDVQNPDAALSKWLTKQKLPAQLPLPFNTDLLMMKGTDNIQGVDVPVVVFRHPTEFGFAKVYIFRADGSVNLTKLRDTNASHTAVTVIESPQHRGVKYVILHTFHPVHDGENPLKPFLRPPGERASL